MWLTRILLARRSTPGRMFAGKNRLIRKITGTQNRNTADRERQISHVERMLSTPYLTTEEEHGHAGERRKEERRHFLSKKQSAKTLGPNVYAVSSGTLTNKSQAILDHLNVSRTQHIDADKINKLL